MNHSPIEQVLDALHYKGSRTGTEFKCHCPAHDDRQASLSVGTAKDGTVLIHCHAGCRTEQVLAAAGLTMADLYPVKSKGYSHRRQIVEIVAEYNYLDADGTLLYQVVRRAPKAFRQRRRDSHGDWIWNLDGVPRVLYRLSELLASPAAQWIFVVEGEKDADNLHKLGLTATTNAQGAGKWHPKYSQYLQGRRVCILPDNDEPGHEHAHDVASNLLGVATEVRVLDLPDLPDKGDVSDWLVDGGNAETLLALVEQTPDYVVSPGLQDVHATGTPDESAGSEQGSKKSQADTLYELAFAHADIFTGQDGESYALLPFNGHRECYKLRSKGFSGWLTALYREVFGRMPGSQAREDAIAALCWDARGTQREVFTRVGKEGEKVYIDLGTEDWSAVEVDSDGWRIVNQPTVAFRRTASCKPLPVPQRGAKLTLLQKYFNIEPEHWPLVAAWAVAALNSSGPYPILVLAGEQGTAKSTTLKVLKELIDPTAAGLRGKPTEIRDLMIAAGNGWLLAFDNVSYLNSDLSDALCRVATGGGYAKRANYTDDGEFLLDVQRPVAINGIGDIITRPDLMDRCILICPPIIPEEKRREESAFWNEFYAERPLLLGALLDALSVALRNYARVQSVKWPRMADFARLAVAAEPVFDSDLSFMEIYDANREEAHATVIETSTMGEHLRALVLVQGHWEGTATELLQELNRRATDAERRASSWPTAPNRVKPVLQRLAASLRHIGVAVDFPPRSDRGGTRRIRIMRLAYE